MRRIVRAAGGVALAVLLAACARGGSAAPAGDGAMAAGAEAPGQAGASTRDAVAAPAVCRDEANGITVRYDADARLDFSEGVPELLLEVLRDGGPLQVVRHVYDDADRATVRVSVRMEDADFDGHADILVYMGAFGTQGAVRERCYRWDGAGFAPAPSFEAILNPRPDADARVVRGSSRWNAAHYVYEEYAFADGEFRLRSRRHELYSPRELPAPFGGGADSWPPALGVPEDFGGPVFVEERF